MRILFRVRDELQLNFLTKKIGQIALSSLGNPSCAVFFIGNNLESIPVAHCESGVRVTSSGEGRNTRAGAGRNTRDFAFLAFISLML